MEIKYYGKKDPLPLGRVMHAGNVNVVYEDGNLRYITCNGDEIIRKIYPAVRGQGWVTAIPAISEEIVEVKADSFYISYHCRYRLNDIDFLAIFKITGSADSRITFEMKGEALSTFLKNRIGFCILHPIDGCAGKDCQISHTDGTIEIKPFPEYIHPDNPFLDIRSMKWKVSDILEVTLTFYGDIFETEDQRNWTDASFKTYSTPLRIPYPVKIQKGTVIHQKVELNIIGKSTAKIPYSSLTTIRLDPANVHPFPEVGIGKSTRDEILTHEDVRLLKKMHFDHYRADICLFNQDWEQKYKNAVYETGLMKCPLELALFFGDDPQYEVAKFIDLFTHIPSDIKSIFLFHKEIQTTRDDLVKAVSLTLRENIPGVRLFAGTNCNFAELNRERPGTSLIDGLVFSIHPQEHAFDNTTLVENLRGQTYAVDSLRQFAGGKMVAVSPLTMQRRFNANIENFETPSDTKEMPWQVDPRQMSLFGGGWTAISFKYLAESGIDTVTYYESTGERGSMMGNRSSRWPGQFVAAKGVFFPLFHVLAFILYHKKTRIMKSISSNPLKVDGLFFYDKESTGIVLVNFSHLQETVRIPHIKKTAKILSLDEHTFDEAGSNNDWLIQAEWEKHNVSDKGLKLTLNPYASLFIRI